MPRLQRVAGQEFDGTCITMVIGSYRIPTLKSSYSDKINPEMLSFQGSQQIDAVTPGGYSVEKGKFSTTASVFRSILAPLLNQVGFGNVVSEVAFSYAHSFLGSDSDYLADCRITALSNSTEAGGKALENEFEITYRQIFWTDRRVTINRLGDIPASAINNGLGLSVF